MSAAAATGVLAAAGIYLLLHRGLVRKVVGFLLLQHAVNLLLVTARAPQRSDAPILPAATPSDPLAQAFVLTAIVVGFGAVIFLLAITREAAQRGDRGGRVPPRTGSAAGWNTDVDDADPGGGVGGGVESDDR